VSADNSGSGSNRLLRELKQLSAGGATAVTVVASNPEEWLREQLAEVLVGGVLSIGGAGADLLVSGAEDVGGAIGSAATSTLDGLEPAGEQLLDLPATLYQPVRTLSTELGIAAPVVGGLIVGVLVALTALAIRTTSSTVTQLVLDAVPGAEALTGPADAFERWRR